MTSFLSGVARRLGFGAEERPAVRRSEADIREWLIQRLAKQLKLPVAEINTSTRFDAYGLDSRVAVQVAGELEKIVERRLSPALLFEYATIDDLARALARDEQSESAEI